MMPRTLTTGNRERNVAWGLTEPERRRNKALAYAGGAALLIFLGAGVAMAAKPSPPPKKRKPPAITVDASCGKYEVADEARLKDDIRLAVRSAQRQGPVDPFTVASGYASQAAPHCATYPKKTSRTEAELFLKIFNSVVAIMTEENLISAQDVLMWTTMAQNWATFQGVPVGG